jgi:hypothetical protein
LVYTAFFKVLGSVVGFASDFLVYCVDALECYPGVCLFEKIINLPNLGAVVNEGDPFFVLVVFGWRFFCACLISVF